jgi:hypothetical protein
LAGRPSKQLADAAGKRVLRGHVDGDNYNLIRAPGLAKALSLTSLSAIGSLLAGSGIPFSTLSGDFAYSEKRLVLQNLLAYGGALGVTANGVRGIHRLDIRDDRPCLYQTRSSETSLCSARCCSAVRDKACSQRTGGPPDQPPILGSRSIR